MEHQLYDQFFPQSEGDETALAPLMDPLCTVLYDALRPVFIQLQSLESLCSLVDILQHEVLASPGCLCYRDEQNLKDVHLHPSCTHA